MPLPSADGSALGPASAGLFLVNPTPAIAGRSSGEGWAIPKFLWMVPTTSEKSAQIRLSLPRARLGDKSCLPFNKMSWKQNRGRRCALEGRQDLGMPLLELISEIASEPIKEPPAQRESRSLLGFEAYFKTWFRACVTRWFPSRPSTGPASSTQCNSKGYGRHQGRVEGLPTLELD